MAYANRPYGSSPYAGDLSPINTAISEGNGSIIVSNYKWLTSTLLAAQQQYAVRPYFTCKIVDDLTLPNTKYTDPAQPISGQVVTAPDGSILAVGKTSDGSKIGFWKISDASVRTNWTAAPSVVLDSSGNYGTANASISVSKYINNTYVIDVYYLTLVSTTYTLSHKRSIDGGATFSAADLSDTFTSTDNVNLSACEPVLQVGGTINGMFMFVRTIGSNNKIGYRYYNGTTWGGSTTFSPFNIDSGDWMIHSLTNYFDGKKYHVVFSGYHTSLGSNTTYGLYHTAFLLPITSNSSTTDIWESPVEIQTSLSTSPTNLNNFKYPQFNFDGTYLNLVFRGDTVTSINEAGIAVATTNYYISQSKDFVNFSYPILLAFTDGTEFSDSNGNLGYSFAKQGSYYYLAGNGKLWQYIKNSITADVSADVTGYQIQDNVSSPSAITLKVGNQNGQWVGPSPTKTGYQAIAKNRKILIYQGYYNSNSVAETVPKDTYYIDEIQQTISSRQNELTITARNLHKSLRSTISRFTYSSKGPDMYVDVFDGSTVGNWNQKSGNWAEANGCFSPTDAILSSPIDYNVSLSGIVIDSYAIYMSVIVHLMDPATSGSVYLYPLWQDSNNWLRLKISAHGSGVSWDYAFQQNLGGTITTLAGTSGTFGSYGSFAPYYPIVIYQYQYNKFACVIGSAGLTASKGNYYDQFNSSLVKLFSDATPGTLFPNTPSTVALGSSGYNTSDSTLFSNFKFAQMHKSQDIQELATNLATKAGIYNYRFERDIEDLFFDETLWNGTFTTKNRDLILTAGNLAIRNVSQISDASIEFDAYCDASDSSANSGFDFIFRSQSASAKTQSYAVRVQRRTDADLGAPNPFIEVSLRLLSTKTPGDVPLMFSTLDSIPSFNNLRFDITTSHHYKVVFNRGWMTVFIDGIQVIAWYDNNVDVTYSTGYIGFDANVNSTLVASNLIANTFWQQIPQFSVNPGDDFETSLLNLIGTVRGYVFSDLFGRMKSILLKSTDLSDYTYQNQLYAQQTNNSDIQYVNQVTVVGSGVAAVAKNATLIGQNVRMREEVIVDYKITSLVDAQNRANKELTDFNKYNAQSDPKQVINIGAELFDVAHIINTGANSSAVDQNLRVYNQIITVGGGANEYSLQLGTGNIS